jgi:hypothetical protein
MNLYSSCCRPIVFSGVSVVAGVPANAGIPTAAGVSAVTDAPTIDGVFTGAAAPAVLLCP